MIDILREHHRKIFFVLILVLLATNIVVWQEIFRKEQQPDMIVSFFDVGQGDSILIEAKDGMQILIDGGPDSKILSLLAQKLPYYDRSLDAVIVTHPHRDHIAGLIDVLKRYDVGVVLESDAGYTTAEYYEFEKLIAEKQIKKITIDRPMMLAFFRDAQLKLLTPTHSFASSTPKNIHDADVVSELNFDGKKILLMGDAERKLERQLVIQHALGDVDVLKVGHHGSKTSSDKDFLQAVKPEYVIISVGARNRYGHPYAEVLSRLASVGSALFRTDLGGTIDLEIRNGDLLFKEEK